MSSRVDLLEARVRRQADARVSDAMHKVEILGAALTKAVENRIVGQ